MSFTIRAASPEDYPAIYDLQKLAYITEAEIYNDYTIPPLVQTFDEMAAECAEKITLIADTGGILAGSLRAMLDEKGTCHIGRVMTHPDYRGRGIASELMRQIEREFPGARRFELYAGELSANNIRLYEHLGYRAYSVKPLSDTINLVYMEKLPL
ncbi:MAG: GNAT family N-acetyltransferase [Brevinematales bacterium]|nr:GNAT family N-acetyltransferase [Brevinematales bacterium]